eukprot:367187_1
MEDMEEKKEANADNTEHSDLEKQIYSHFTDKSIIEKETDLHDNSLFNKLKEDILNDILDTSNDNDASKDSPLVLNTLESVQKFMYENRSKSPLYKVPRNHNHLLLLSQVPSNDTLWTIAFKKAKQQNDFFTMLWMLVQIQTVHIITHIHQYPLSIRNELQHAIGYSRKNKPKPITDKTQRMYINTMQMATVNEDCIVIALKMKQLGYNPLVLNCANQNAPAAAICKYSEEGTQEECIFKRTTIYLSLWPHRYSNPLKPLKPYAPYDEIWKDDKDKKKQIPFYPMDDKYGGIYSKNVLVIRDSEEKGYALLPLNERRVIAFISVAAEAHGGGGLVELTEKEVETYKDKIRTIYQIGFEHGHDCLVLGALGCGAFGNPPRTVAKLFHDVLVNEFNGCFQNVIFAIIWDHNSTPKLVETFTEFFPENKEIFTPKETNKINK